MSIIRIPRADCKDIPYIHPLHHLLPNVNLKEFIFSQFAQRFFSALYEAKHSDEDNISVFNPQSSLEARRWFSNPQNRPEIAKVKTLSLQGLSLTALPAELFVCTSLEGLDLSLNFLETIPLEIRNLSKLLDLDLSKNQFESFPDAIVDMTSLTELDLSLNALSTIPPTLTRLSSLQAVYFQNNPLNPLPQVVGDFIALRENDLFTAQVTVVPSQTGTTQAMSEVFITFPKHPDDLT